MATIQSQIDQMAGKGFGVWNLSLNAGGVARMAMGKKDVYLTLSGKDSPYELLVASDPQKLGFASDYLGLNSVIMYADVTDNSELCEHPLESGAKIVDHQIQLPVEIKLQIVLPYYLYKEVYEELKRLKDQGTYVCVHTKAGVYDRMVFKDIPHRESVENIDRLVFDCTLRQAFLTTGLQSALKVGDVKYAADSSTKKAGIKKGNMVDQSVLQNIKDLADSSGLTAILRSLLGL
jgi:hypothetical protein